MLIGVKIFLGEVRKSNSKSKKSIYKKQKLTPCSLEMIMENSEAKLFQNETLF